MARLAMAASAIAVLGGCSSASDMLSKDAEWFSRPKFFADHSINASVPPLSSSKPVSPEDLVAADGTCVGMAPRNPADSNAMDVSGNNGAAVQPAPGAAQPAPAIGVALEMSECEVVRSEGVANNISIGANERGEREVTLTYLQGARPGIYRFTSGRLKSIERAPEPPPKKPAPRSKKKR